MYRHTQVVSQEVSRVLVILVNLTRRIRRAERRLNRVDTGTFSALLRFKHTRYLVHRVRSSRNSQPNFVRRSIDNFQVSLSIRLNRNAPITRVMSTTRGRSFLSAFGGTQLRTNDRNGINRQSNQRRDSNT